MEELLFFKKSQKCTTKDSMHFCERAFSSKFANMDRKKYHTVLGHFFKYFLHIFDAFRHCETAKSSKKC